MTNQAQAFVALGSNLGDRAAHLCLAVRAMLDASLPVVALSRIYETAHVTVEGFTNEDAQPDFLNMVAELRGRLPAPEPLLARLLRIEYALGRRRDTANVKQARPIDLDLLLYKFADVERAPAKDLFNDEDSPFNNSPNDKDSLIEAFNCDAIFDNEFLTLPHPRLHLRRFVLAPFAEIAPRVVHPTFNQTISELLVNLTDDSSVKRYKA